MANEDGGGRKTGVLDRYRALARNAAFVFGLRLLQRSLRIVALYFVVRALSRETFGEYQFVLSCLALSAIFTLPGLNNSVMQSVARGFPGIYRRAVPRALAASLIGSALLGGMAAYYLASGRGELGGGLLLGACLFPLAYGLEQWKSYKSGGEDFAGLFRVEGLAAVVLAVLMVAAVTRMPGPLLVPLVVLLGVQTGLNLVMTSATLREVPRDAPGESGSVAYGTRTTFYSAFNTLANQADKLLIFYFLSPASLAVFYAAERIPELTKGVVQDVAAVMAPRFAKRARYTRDLDRILRTMGLVAGAIIVAAAFLVLPWVVSTLFGDAYEASIPYAQALMCSIAIGNVATLRYRYVASKLDEASSRNVNIGMSLTRVAASLILVPLYGLLGAVISAFIYRIAMTAIVHVVVKRRYLDA